MFSSRRGFGRTRKQVTFSSSTTWTAPSNVTIVDSASGRGGAGFTYTLEQLFPGGYYLPYNTTTFADIYSMGTNIFNQWNSNITATAPPGSTYTREYKTVFVQVNTGNPRILVLDSSYVGSQHYKTVPYTINYGGITNSSAKLNTISSSTDIVSQTTYTFQFGNWSSTGNQYIVQLFKDYSETFTGTGASSTALGLTFPGGVGGPASTTTFTLVSVTPGTTYNINVADGGFITLVYYT